VAVEVNCARVVLAAAPVEPVTADGIGKWIVIAEEISRYDNFPYAGFDLLPVLDDLRTLYFNLLSLRGLVDYALRV
jgi:hypothetical protein